MSLLPALEETEKSAGHGWNTSNRFGMDTPSGGGKQFDYHHLISQNNTGDVPDALVEEEVILENNVQGEEQGQQQQQQQLALQQQQQQQSLIVKQQQQSQQKSQQQQQHLTQQQQYLQQKQTMLQNQKRGIQQAQNRKQPAQQKMLYTVVHSGNQHQQQVLVSNKSVRQPGPQQAGQSILIQQGQNRPVGVQQQSLLNSSCSASEEEINQKLLQTQKEIEENDKKLVSLGLQPHMSPPVISTQSEFNSQQQILNNCDYLGSISAQSPAGQLDTGGRIRQILTQPQGSTTQRKVDINFPDSNGGYPANTNQRIAQGVQGHQKTQVITVSGRGLALKYFSSQQRTPIKQSVMQIPVQGNQTTSTSYKVRYKVSL
ncbi:transcription factor SPT20 homolog [Ruditapes philippinarum]|uniref:transcription factor SPT20 homolog n=1 Tax=Ruditapes philippinarum TaxID=129788 RepID=UPI00295BA0FE|nr:transcription factor SPT20 homolog [Ruditapes philippinarum]